MDFEDLRESAAIYHRHWLCASAARIRRIPSSTRFIGQRLNRVHPVSIPKVMANAGASHISIEFGITGPVFTFSTACSSSGHAIGHAFRMVQSGATPLAIAGRQRSPLQLRHPQVLGGDARRLARILAVRFSKDRKGMILGEGAAMLILEPLEAARARGARIHAEIVGFGMSSDATHITQPSKDGAARTMRGPRCVKLWQD